MTIHDTHNITPIVALYNLVPLTGSEKQVEWAIGIREKLIFNCDRWAKPDQNLNPFLTRQNIELMFNAASTAKFWIDNRFSTRPDLMLNSLFLLLPKERRDAIRSVTATEKTN